MVLTTNDIYEECYIEICRNKGIDKTDDGLQKYIAAMTSIYHAVCLDIDDTLTCSKHTEKIAILKALSTLVKRNVMICFITGRGKTKALDFLCQLKESLKQYDSEIKEFHFSRWYCITNNGVSLYYSDNYGNSGFLEESISLVNPEIKTKYLDIKGELQEEVASLLSRITGIGYEKIISDSNHSIGENSLRFPLPEKYAHFANDDLIENIRNIVEKRIPNVFGVSRGIYNKNNMTVIEISMTNKGKAINQVEEYLGIPQNKMLRVGDQGDYSGNDYEMLNCSSGFSVGKYSQEEDRCWPVIQSDGYGFVNVIAGAGATATLLNSLKIFPTICLETPSKDIYLPRLAYSEHMNISANRDTYNYYENQIKYSLKDSAHLFFGSSDIINKKTGGFYISDSEYALLKAKNPEHILFKIYDKAVDYRKNNRANLKFALRTDTGLLLRGPWNYYSGLAFRKERKITKLLVSRLNRRRINFFKVCINEIRKSDIDVNDSITRRVILGILDSVRDYLLLCINFVLQNKVSNEDVIYVFSQSSEKEEDKKLMYLYSLAKANLCFMYNSLFGIIDANYVINIRNFLEKDILPVTKIASKTIETLDEDFNYNKACRVWREIDSFYENVVAIETSITKYVNEYSLVKQRICFYGIRYGSLELPIIAAMLLDIKYRYFDIKYSIGVICISSDYSGNHKGTLATNRHLKTLYNCDSIIQSDNYHVVMDDNLVTGRTIQIAINLLVNKKIYPHKVFVVRYPAVNRVEHMFLPYHGAPDVDLFWKFIYGLTSPTPYTKLEIPFGYSNNEKDKYLDLLGNFNKTRKYVNELLYKNGLYEKRGEITR